MQAWMTLPLSHSYWFASVRSVCVHVYPRQCENAEVGQSHSQSLLHQVGDFPAISIMQAD